jgi:hypothetical protein
MSELDTLSTNSPLDELKAEYAAPKKPPRLFKRLPAGSGKSVAEYCVLKNAAMEESLKADEKLAQDCDLLVGALVAIHRHDPDHPAADERGLVELGAWAGEDLGGPLRFDQRLCTALGLEPGTAREICLRMFDDNEIALGAQAAVLAAWMTDTGEQALQDFTEGSSTAR